MEIRPAYGPSQQLVQDGSRQELRQQVRVLLDTGVYDNIIGLDIVRNLDLQYDGLSKPTLGKVVREVATQGLYFVPIQSHCFCGFGVR